MTYEKIVVKSDGSGKKRIYGPYLYKSVRTKSGKVKTVYIGKQERKKPSGLKAIKDMLNIF